MGKKNGSQKRDRRRFLQKLNDLATVFQQEDFTEDHRWYRDVLEADVEDDVKVYFFYNLHQSITAVFRM